jgi:hypothetical protein
MPPPLGASPKSDSNVGVKGALPLGCLPLWGREGVTLILFEKNLKNAQNRISIE